jgi:hypothetical protein
MSGIHRRENGTIKVHTTLGANGWECQPTEHLGMPFFYTRGEEVIELHGADCAFYSIGDRRVTNGTWESIVERFAVAKQSDKESATKDALDALMYELFTHFDLDSNIDRDPGLFLAYDRLAVLMGDDGDAEGVERAKALLGGD